MVRWPWTETTTYPWTDRACTAYAGPRGRRTATAAVVVGALTLGLGSMFTLAYRGHRASRADWEVEGVAWIFVFLAALLTGLMPAVFFALLVVLWIGSTTNLALTRRPWLRYRANADEPGWWWDQLLSHVHPDPDLGDPPAPVDVSTADDAALATVPGMTPQRRRQLLELRDRFGPPRDVEALRRPLALTETEMDWMSVRLAVGGTT